METQIKKKLTAIWILLGILVVCAGTLLGWYWYDGHVDRSGWETREDGTCYLDFHGQPVTGWQEIGGRTYYFGPQGAMQTGWLRQGQLTYYLNTDGTLTTGWQQLEGDTYYFEENGALATGLLDLEGKRYLLDPEGKRQQGFETLEGRTYYFTPEGPAQVGPLTLDGDRYYFDPDGAMVTGWLSAGGRDYCFSPEGKLYTGMQVLEGKRYFFTEEGYAVHGWLDQGEYSYYFGADGAAVTGPQEIDGRTHYFTPQGIHVVLVNRDNPIPDYYDPDVVKIFKWNLISRVAREPFLKMLEDCVAAGHEYTFNSSYRTHQNQIDIVEARTQEYMAQGMDYGTAYQKTLETAAVPGTSEHEMGLAADILGKEANIWLGEHCWDYGFILRYPPEKAHITGINFEPWHFRYVGTEVSIPMRDSGQCLEEFLGADPVN